MSRCRTPWPWASDSASASCREQVHRDRRRQRALAAQERGQVLPLDILHHQEHQVAALAEIEDLGDVRVGEAAGQPGFPLEAGPVLIGLIRFLVVMGHAEDFHRDRLWKIEVRGAEDQRHAPLAQPLIEPISALEDPADERVGGM